MGDTGVFERIAHPAPSLIRLTKSGPTTCRRPGIGSFKPSATAWPRCRGVRVFRAIQRAMNTLARGAHLGQ